MLPPTKVATVDSAAALNAQDRAWGRRLLQANLNPGFELQTVRLTEPEQPRVFRYTCTIIQEDNGA